ncbi:unnamed protein product [Polarella glacialis]|uniref:Uncharacterized protein n=1 Tax=Polarella glacialis TaxID=89957 RepID=A0A813G584_POLGL|nr:unnamed protein product [Polarella glacialis]
MRSGSRGAGHGGGRRGSRAKAAVAVLGCLALGAVTGQWLPGRAQAAPKIKELELAAPAAPSGMNSGGVCGAALTAGYQYFEGERGFWAAASSEGRQLPRFGRAALAAEQGSLAAFENELEKQGGSPGSCGAQRAALGQTMRKEVWATFLAQRAIAEQVASDKLSRQILDAMSKRGGPLRVQEKIDLLRKNVDLYKDSVEKLLPEWAATQGDPEEAKAERRLGELQFTIEESGEGRFLHNDWKHSRAEKLLSKRAHGMSVSVDPAFRVLLRPEGLGNLQIFSVGPVGPPSSPATVNVGIMNDGSIADVYREHPTPPKIAVQPAMNVNVNLR